MATGATGVLPVANGGTGLSSTPTNGQLNIGNGSGFTRATLTAGSGISITNGSGSITIATSGTGGVTSLNGQTGAITNTDYGAIGSYVIAVFQLNAGSYAGPNTTYAGSSLFRQIDNQNGVRFPTMNTGYDPNVGYPIVEINSVTGLGLSGTWRLVTRSYSNGGIYVSGLFVRIS